MKDNSIKVPTQNTPTNKNNMPKPVIQNPPKRVENVVKPTVEPKYNGPQINKNTYNKPKKSRRVRISDIDVREKRPDETLISTGLFKISFASSLVLLLKVAVNIRVCLSVGRYLLIFKISL